MREKKRDIWVLNLMTMRMQDGTVDGLRQVRSGDSLERMGKYYVVV